MGMFRVAAMVTCLLAASIADGATFNVTTTADGAVPGLSLREAFDMANSDGEDSVIVLSGLVYELDVCGVHEDSNATGDLDHTEPFRLTIQGNNATIAQTCMGDRVIHNLASGATLVLEDVTITGGNAGLTDFGGGVWMEEGDLEITGSIIAGNSTGEGGGGVQVESGDLTVMSSQFEDNESGLPGGAIEISSGSATVMISDTIFHQNEGEIGGAVAFGSAASVLVERCDFTENEATQGAAMFLGLVGAVHIIDTSVEMNTSNGGSVVVYRDLTMPSGNDPNVIIERSTIAGNTAVNAALEIESNGRFLRLVNSTVSSNNAIGVDVLDEGMLDTIHSTIVLNQEVNVQALGLAELRTFATIIAEVQGSASKRDCGLGVGADSGGYNFSGDGTCGLGLGPGDISFGGDPKLASLGEYGGFTRTHAPFSDSPVLDLVPVVDCEAMLGPGAVDQRGVLRPVGMQCDTGSFEGNLFFPSTVIVIVLVPQVDPPPQIPPYITALLQRIETTGARFMLMDDDDAASRADELAMATSILVAPGVDPDLAGQTLRGLAVPLIVLEPRLYPALGMVGPSPNAFGVTSEPKEALLIVAPEHPLAAGLHGIVVPVSSPAPFNFGRPRNTADVVARILGSPPEAAIFSYEKGARMFGLSAPEMRVGFFATPEALVVLSEAGEALLEGAILATIEEPPDADFRRGDADDDGRVTLLDALRILAAILVPHAAPLGCADAADADDDGQIDLRDGLLVLHFALLGRASLPPPGPVQCGPDPSPDELSCEEYSSCP